MRLILIFLSLALSIHGAVVPRSGWRVAADLMKDGDWGCANVVVAPDLSSVRFTAGAAFSSVSQTLGARLGVTGDFAILAEVQSSSTLFAGITLVGQTSTGPEFWQGLRRLDVGYGNTTLTIFSFTGTSAAAVQSFPFPGGRPAGPVRLEVAKVGNQLIFYGNGVEAGRITDPGLFPNDYVVWGASAGPNTTVTITDMKAAVPDAAPDPALLAGYRQKVARSSTGSALRDIASDRGLIFGTEMAPEHLGSEIYRNTLGREFGQLVPGNAMKFDAVHPSPTRYTFCGGDTSVTFAELNHMKVRGHVLLWHNQLPSWVTTGTFSQPQAQALMEDHIKTVVGHYKGRIAWWDVVNEAISDTAPNPLKATFWSTNVGPNFIDDAFRLANAADPDAKLFYNDYNVEGINNKSTAMFSMVQGMLARGVPIHGVGLQTHFQTTGSPTRQSMIDNIKRFGDLGLEVQITELDVRIAIPTTPAKLTAQANVYRDVAAACNSHPKCTLVTTWGITDAISWIDNFAPGFSDALMFDRQYAPKASYDSTVDEIKKRALKPKISDGGAIIHAGLTGDVSPGSLADLYGARMSVGTETATFGTLPTTLGGVQVLVNGVAAPLLYVSPGQIILQIPYATKIGRAQVVVVTGGASSISAPMNVKAAAPFILTYGANRGIVQNSDYSLNGVGNCAKAGSFITVYMMGSGPLDGAVASGVPVPTDRPYAQTLPTIAALGTTAAPVLFAGMTPGLYGLMQVNVSIPQGVSGDVELRIDVGTESSNRPLVCVTP